MVQNGPNWANWSKMVKITDFFFGKMVSNRPKWKARRTKSRGLKGLQLELLVEVGARRAPRLLVANKVGHILTKTHKRPHSSLARKSPAQRLENPTWQILQRRRNLLIVEMFVILEFPNFKDWLWPFISFWQVKQSVNIPAAVPTRWCKKNKTHLHFWGLRIWKIALGPANRKYIWDEKENFPNS